MLTEKVILVNSGVFGCCSSSEFYSHSRRGDGFHAQASAVFVATATQFESSVAVEYQDRQVNGKSIMSLLMLEAPVRATIRLICDGVDELAAMTTLTELMGRGLKEFRCEEFEEFRKLNCSVESPKTELELLKAYAEHVESNPTCSMQCIKNDLVK